MFGCANIDELPGSYRDIDFLNSAGHFSDLGIYEIGRDFPDIDIDLAMNAAQAGLRYGGFNIVRVERNDQMVTGNRAMDWDHFSDSAAIYLRENGAGVQVKVVYNRGSGIEEELIKPVALQILDGMHLYLIAEGKRNQDASASK
jgi:hypothetical protein